MSEKWPPTREIRCHKKAEEKERERFSRFLGMEKYFAEGEDQGLKSEATSDSIKIKVEAERLKVKAQT